MAAEERRVWSVEELAARTCVGAPKALAVLTSLVYAPVIYSIRLLSYLLILAAIAHMRWPTRTHPV